MSGTATRPSKARRVRERAREEMRAAILDAARVRLAADGANGLSLRAVARDVGMVSSAVYRYVPNRDALLTALIIEAYDALGEAAEVAEAEVERADVFARFLAIGHAARRWAVAHPHEWALIFGSPVSGYAAPMDTVRAATRIPILLVALLRDAREAGVPLPDSPVDAATLEAMRPMIEFFADAAPEEAMVRGLMAWTYLNGAISAELFGHRNNVIENPERFFDAEMRRMAAFVGMPPADD